MVFSEGSSVFTAFKVGGSEGMLSWEKLNVQDFRNVVLGILADLFFHIFISFRLTSFLKIKLKINTLFFN